MKRVKSLKSIILKLSLAVLTAAALLAVLTGCSKGPEEEEAKKIVAALVEASLPLNDIYYGDGMKVEKKEDDMPAFYANVVDDAPYLTEAELREATLEVFTENFASAIIFKTFLEGYSSEGTSGVVYARYIENGDRLQKRIDFEQLIESGKSRTYDLENIEILSSRKNEIKATLHSYVAGVRDVDVEVMIRREKREPNAGSDAETAPETTETNVLEGGGYVWRLDSPTY